MASHPRITRYRVRQWCACAWMMSSKLGAVLDAHWWRAELNPDGGINFTIGIAAALQVQARTGRWPIPEAKAESLCQGGRT